MSQDPPGDVTVLLKAWAGGDGAALARLVPIVHGQLRRIARRYMRGERDWNLARAWLMRELAS